MRKILVIPCPWKDSTSLQKELNEIEERGCQILFVVTTPRGPAHRPNDPAGFLIVARAPEKEES